MEYLTEIIAILFGAGGLGKVIYDKWSNKGDEKEKEFERLRKAELELSVKVARLEERILVNAKNKVKKHKYE